MNNILIISGHNDLNSSFANKIILEKLQQNLPQAQVKFLDQLYADFKIDVVAEQQALIEADTIILQFPIFWYAMPALMKKWQEDVFVYGFAHGSTGNKLHGKKLIVSFTTGAPEEMYREGGLQNYPIDAFLPAFKQFANLCGLEWIGHIYTGGLSYLSAKDSQAVQEMQQRAELHADRVIDLVNSI